MKIIVAGYGKMGHEIERIAHERGHQTVAFLGSDFNWDSPLPEADVMIEFTNAAAAPLIAMAAFRNNMALVSGTTGWNEKVVEIKQRAVNENKTFFYASNFSIGMNIFSQINSKLASFLKHYPDYTPAIHEVHHIHKKDAPSGTAITLAAGILKECTGYSGWEAIPTERNGDGDESNGKQDHSTDVKTNASENITNNDKVLKISSERTGEVPGTHIVSWQSDVDTIEIKHTAHSRKGFALGAVIAAEWLQGKKGVFGMEEFLSSEF